MCADFQFFLNRQGPQGIQGPKGDKGDKGDSITIYDGTVTPLIYTLIFDKGNGNTFETQNIRYPLEDRLGSYVRWDGTTQYLGTPDYADLTGTVGEVRLATTVNVGNNTVLNTDAVSYELFAANNSTISAQLALKADKATTYTKTEVDNLVTPKADKTYVDTQLATKANSADVYTKTQTDTLLAGKANTVHTHPLSQITNAGTFAAKNSLDYTSAELTNKPTLGSLAAKNTVDYVTEVTNKPTIPTVGNGTITVTQGGVTKGTFTTNQSGDSTIALDAGGGGGTSFTPGTALELTPQDVLNVKIDGTTITTNASGELVASGGGGTIYSPGDAIDLTNDTISVKYDNDSIYVNQDGELVANLEDITDALEAILGGDASIFSDYYTKAQCDGRFAPLLHTHTISQITDFPTLATVAISGSYNDLTDKPTIPSTTNMVTTDTVQNITGVKTFTGNSTNFSSSSGNEIHIGNNTHYTILGTWSNGKGYLYNTLENKIYVNGTTDWLLNKGMLDGTTITYDTTTDKISAIANTPIATSSSTGIVQPDNTTITIDGNGIISAIGGSTGDEYIEQTSPVAPLEYQASEKVGSYTTTDVTQDSSNEHKYTPTSTNGEIKFSYEQPASYTYLKTGELKFKTNSETPYNGTIITCNTYKTFLPMLFFDTGNIICRVPEANQTSSNSYHDINLGTTSLNTEYTFSTEFISGVWNVKFNGSTYTYDTQANSITFDTSYSSNMYNSIKFGGAPSRIAWVDISNYVFKINSTTIYADTDSKLLLNYDNDVLNVNSNNELTFANEYYTKSQVQDNINQGLKGYILTDSKGLAEVEQKYQSGVSTGVDTIKADNYTINGTPTITDDGVTSGFSANNFLNIGSQITYTNFIGHSFKIECKFKHKDTSAANTNQCIFQMFNKNAINSLRTYNNKVVCSLTTSSYSERTINVTLNEDEEYIVTLEHDNTSGKYNLSLYNNLYKLLGNVDTFNTGDLSFDSDNYSIFNIGRGTTNVWQFLSEIDLNSFKIYIDGDLKYQACLKIPYTLSFTNEKIVDSDYRYRTLDQYEQYGSTPYYTLDSGVNYTLPLNELSGPISLYVQNQEDTPHIVDSYINTTTGDWYRIYSDKWCEQGGKITQTADQDFTARQVTFLKPFADSNYNATVTPTTCSSHAIMSAIESKSSSAITIGAYGFNSGNTITQIDWRAEGYIV